MAAALEVLFILILATVLAFAAAVLAGFEEQRTLQRMREQQRQGN